MGGKGNAAVARRGVWEPLPAILYGYAIHPLSSSSNRESKFGGNEEPSGSELMIVELDVGDDVYAFERYVPKGKEVEGIWYRGYV